MTHPAESVVHGSRGESPASIVPRGDSQDRAQPRDLPAVDRLLRERALAALAAEHGHTLIADTARAVLDERRAAARAGGLPSAAAAPEALVAAIADRVQARLTPRLRAALNLTGTVIHTNLGRAPLAEAALAEIAALMRGPVNLEYDLASGGRGERDDLVEGLLRELIGAEAATVVNNNAAAVLLTLAALARRKEVIVSRGELVEIGGSFRLPDVMAGAGVKLVEVGATNRTHPADYEHAIGPRTALLMKVHTSNYAVQGFTRAVAEAELASIAHARGLPLVSDLGSGALVDLTAHGLPREPLPQDMLRAGVDVVTFSGDKLLGGPQAGLIVGRADLVARIRRHPLKRALRLSKLPLAALEATLRLYLRPERLMRDLPTLRLLTRPVTDIEATARAVQVPLAQALAPRYSVNVAALQGQIGSGSLPVERLPSSGLSIEPSARRGPGAGSAGGGAARPAAAGHRSHRRGLPAARLPLPGNAGRPAGATARAADAIGDVGARLMIVGTAGHIDHGKTALVRALTGVDTDRLSEEKRRGISIELGYAFLDTPAGERIGFIDAPGHEKLVHTMIAGASGIDYALLLLVAADDGPMPQTREHLAVLSLLGLARGAVVITKADRADAARITQVERDMAALLAATPLAGAPMLAVSAHTGAGLDALRALLWDAARATRHDASDAPDAQAFRLAIDRAFSLSGAGTVVTGTIHAGRVAVGDELALVPAPGGQPIRARARSLHAQGQPVERAHAGQRCAVALVGIARERTARGQWLTDPAVALDTDRLDMRLTLWAGEAQALKSGTPVQAHIGAAHVPGTVALLDVPALAPGLGALAQLVLHKRTGAWHGDRVLLRDASGARTLAGGRVLDPCAPARYRRTPQRLAELAALEEPDSATRLAALIDAAPFGVDVTRLIAAQGLRTPPPLPADALRAEGAGSLWALDATRVQTLGDAARAALARFHQQQPDEPGPDAARLKRLAAPRLPAPLWQALVARLIDAGTIARAGACLHLPEHGAQLSAAETRIAQATAPALRAAGFEGAWVRDLARDAKQPEALVRATLARLARRGELHQVVKDLYCAPEHLRRLAAIARDIAAKHDGAVQAAAFRDATGLGRKRAIQILEYFDRIGFTRRIGRAHDEAHRPRPESDLFAEI